MDTFGFLGCRWDGCEKYEEVPQKKHYTTANRCYSFKHFISYALDRNYIFGIEDASCFAVPSLECRRRMPKPSRKRKLRSDSVCGACFFGTLTLRTSGRPSNAGPTRKQNHRLSTLRLS